MSWPQFERRHDALAAIVMGVLGQLEAKLFLLDQQFQLARVAIDTHDRADLERRGHRDRGNVRRTSDAESDLSPRLDVLQLHGIAAGVADRQVGAGQAIALRSAFGDVDGDRAELDVQLADEALDLELVLSRADPATGQKPKDKDGKKTRHGVSPTRVYVSDFTIAQPIYQRRPREKVSLSRERDPP